MAADGLQVTFEARLQVLLKAQLRQLWKLLLSGPQLSAALLAAKLQARLTEQRSATRQAQAQLQLELRPMVHLELQLAIKLQLHDAPAQPQLEVIGALSLPWEPLTVASYAQLVQLQAGWLLLSPQLAHCSPLLLRLAGWHPQVILKELRTQLCGPVQCGLHAFPHVFAPAIKRLEWVAQLWLILVPGRSQQPR